PSASGARVQLTPRVIRYTATSQHSDKYGSYTAINAFDGLTYTTWAESASGYGIGEGIMFTCATFGQDTISIEIWAGYHKSSSTYSNNGRPKDITVTVDGSAQSFTQSDRMSSQTITISGQAGKPFVEFGIYIDSVYKGKRWQDTCISEIQVH
ncbi:MAG: hypothetical protein IJ074_01250, partial [Clostridia bacterium]|nr:hypothetical protein [Clostridia bacterium]